MKRFVQAARGFEWTAMVLWMLVPAAWADEFSFTKVNGTATLAKYSGTNAVVKIPAAFEGVPVTAIGPGAFSDQYRMVRVEIPDSVERIGEQAFVYCAGLTNVVIGRGVASIGDGAFRSCGKLAAITVENGNPAYASVEGVLFNKAGTSLIRCPPRKKGSYDIPVGVTQIVAGAFARCAGLTEIAMPDGVVEIGDWAFEGCGLSAVAIPDSVQSLGSGAFSSCARLEDVAIGKGVVRLGHRTFERCGLKRVAISDHLVEIGDWAFYSCTRLGGIDLPTSVVRIGHRAFFHCTGLADVEIPDRVVSIGDWAFGGCTGLGKATVGEGVADLGEGAFADCPDLASINFKGNAPRAAPEVFGRSEALTVYYRPGTRGWEAALGDRPTALWEPEVTTEDGEDGPGDSGSGDEGTR